MEYKDIGSLLANLKKSLISNKRKKEVVIQAIFKNTGALVEETNISWSGDTVHVIGSGSLKSEIALKKSAIIQAVYQNGVPIKDIR